MKLQKILIPFLAVAISVTACYRDEIASMQKQIDTFTQVHINPILEQVKQIDAAIDLLKNKDAELASDIQKLQEMKVELDGKLAELDTRIADAIQKADGNRAAIEALEATRDEMQNRLNSIDTAIEDLKKRVGILEEQIKELETLKEQLSALDGRLNDANARIDWIQANYVSLEKFKETVEAFAPVFEDLREIKESLGEVLDYIPEIDSRFDRDEAEIDALQEETAKIREDYAAAIAQARADVLDILDEKVTELKNWVISSISDSLEDYYNIAATDQLLANLKATIEKGYGDADAELLKKIEGLTEDLAKAKEEIEAAYKKAIQDVADEFDKKYKEQGGKIENLEKKLTSIEAEISDLGDIRTRLSAVEQLASDTKSALEAITGRVNALEEQAKAIEEDIEKLKGFDKKINERIDSLGKAHQDSTQNLREEIERLKKADATIKKTIEQLQAYVDGELTSSIKDWANQTFATLERQNAMADSLVTIFGYLGLTPDGKGGWTSRKFDEMSEWIKGELDDLSGWVSTKFDDYYNIATIEEKLAALSASSAENVDSVKQNLRAEIAALKSALTTDYETYIKKALAKGGIIDKAISDSVNTLRKDMNLKLAGITKDIDELKVRLTALENVVQSVVFIPEYDDGKIFIPSEFNESTKKYSNPKVDVKLRYKINTKNADFDPDNYTITGDLVDAASATKVVYAGNRIDFSSVTYKKEKGTLECIFNTKDIPASFYDESKSAALSLTISDDKTDISSSYVGLRLEKVAGGGGGGGGEDPVGNFRVDPAAISVGNQGGITTAMVLAVSSLTWEISSKPDWVDVQVIGYSLLRTYNGTQFISVAISKNTSDEARDGEVVFSEVGLFTSETAILKIHQLEREAQTLSFSPALPSAAHFDWEGNTDETSKSFVYRVTPSDQISDWTVSYPQNVRWLHVRESESLGAGVRDVTISVDRRTKSKAGYYTEAHEADVTFTSVSGEVHTVHVIQDFRPYGELTFTPSEMKVEFDWNVYGESNAYIYKVQPTDSLTTWTYRTIDPFDTYFDGRGYSEGSHDRTTGESRLTVYPKNRNTGFTERSGKISFTTADGQTDYTFTAIQKARPAQTIELSPNTSPVEFDWGGKTDGSDTYKVYVIASDDINDWDTPAKDADWFSVRKNSDGNGDYFQIYNVESFEKSENDYREGHITVRPAGPDDKYKEDNKVVLTVKQYKRPAQTLTLGMEPGALEFRWDAMYPKVEPKQVQTYEISVDASDGRSDWDYYLPGNGKPKQDDFFTVSKTRKGTTDYVVVSAKANNNKSDDEPSTTLTIESSTGVKYEFALKQKARPEQTLEFNPASGSSFNFGWKGGSDKLTVTSSDKLDDWTIEGKPSWLTIEKGANNDGVVEVTIAVGKMTTYREPCTLEIVNANGHKLGEFTVAQDARVAQTFEPSPASGTEFEFYKNGNSRETGESSVTINLNPSDTEYDYSVTKSDDSSWCKVDNPKDGTLTFSVEDLGRNNSRSCTVTIKSATESQTVTYTVTQNKTYIMTTIPTTKEEITSGKDYTYTISAYGEGYKVFYETVSGSGTLTVKGIGDSEQNATDISKDVKITINANKCYNNKTLTFYIIDSSGNEIDALDVIYTRSGIMRYTYYVQAQK